ncbi:hypothetical protein Pth03_32650 [Planotetraspora thailandica]|uniref:Uncharacterized protein n=1 Tax=Planotetraspora thailandica TaxID=487172 RepID=A0A8J3XWL3_9ACTN|nr:hypothetical protein [Planotetraspora thailandica]GII54876.1 hypothetical protein Pth03_32650 [Planotetraspora thailandica]
MRDEYLLAALRMAVGIDPVPGRVSADARAAFKLRLPGGIIAAPVETSRPHGARGGTLETNPSNAGSSGGRGGAPGLWAGGPRLHRFTTPDLTIDVEPVVADGRLEVAGQVSSSSEPDPGWHVEVRTAHITKTRELPRSGQFAVGGLPVGWFSVVCHRPGEPAVSTRWLHVRP